ncbi:MAG: flagellar motor switch protein FliM [Bryobacteraceae bacterium]
MDRSLSQEEIDSVFSTVQGKKPDDAGKNAAAYDFRRPDRIAKDQLRAIHLLHDNFARNLASSLSAFLRAYAVVNLVSVEQLSFSEFSQCLPSPTCLVSLAMKPYEGNAVLEINSSLVFPILEMLLGGSGKASAKIAREVTEIEQVVLDGLYRIILNDLKQAWHSIIPIDFTIEARETEPQLLQIMAPNEAVVAIGLEVRIAECSGMINIGMPSIIIKMLRQKFDQQWSVRRSESTLEEQGRMLRIMQPSIFLVDARLQGPTVLMDDLLRLTIGDVLTFDYPVERPVDFLVNGKLKYRGHVATTGRKKVFLIDELHKAG